MLPVTASNLTVFSPKSMLEGRRVALKNRLAVTRKDDTNEQT